MPRLAIDRHSAQLVRDLGLKPIGPQSRDGFPEQVVFALRPQEKDVVVALLAEEKVQVTIYQH